MAACSWSKTPQSPISIAAWDVYDNQPNQDVYALADAKAACVELGPLKCKTVKCKGERCLVRGSEDCNWRSTKCNTADDSYVGYANPTPQSVGMQCMSNIPPASKGYCDCNKNGLRDPSEPIYGCSPPGQSETSTSTQ